MSFPMSSRRRIRLRAGLAGAAAIGIACIALPGAAEAQFYGFFDTWSQTWRAEPPVRELPPRRYAVEEPLSRTDIRELLESRGFTVTNAIRRNGDVYLADVVNRRGRQVRLVVDAFDGRVLERFAGALPRPAVGLREEPPASLARSPRFADEEIFDEADRFADRRILRERSAPEEGGVGPAPVTPDVEPRVIEGFAPRAVPSVENGRSVARVEPEAGEGAKLPLLDAPLPPRRPATMAHRMESEKSDASSAKAGSPAASPKLPSQASRDPVGKPAQTAKPVEAVTAAPGPVAATEAKPSAEKPQNAPRVIPLFKVPQDQIRAEAEAAERAAE